MTVLAFDTHAAANEYERAGFTRDQVEALVNIGRQHTALPDISALATKFDVTEQIGEVRTEIAALKADIAAKQVQTITILISAGAILGGLLVAFSKLLH